MRPKKLPVLLAAAAMVVGFAIPGTAQIEPRADRILREMGQYLASASEFTFEAEVAYDAFAFGQEIQYGGSVQVSVRRPARLRVEYDGDERRNRVVYDGERITVYHAGRNVYAAAESDAGIDVAVDRVFEASGFSVPIADLVYADPYAVLIESVEAGRVVGRHAVDGTPCHHLAFSQEALDWQIWIEDGPRPVPRKLVITYKNEPGSPQYVARISGWDFQPRVADSYFEFRPPPGAAQIEFLPAPEIVEEEVEP
jgi:hypothetical protein